MEKLIIDYLYNNGYSTTSFKDIEIVELKFNNNKCSCSLITYVKYPLWKDYSKVKTNMDITIDIWELLSFMSNKLYQ